MYCTGLFKLWEFYITGWSEINQNELINYDIGIYLGNLHQVIVDSLRNLFHFWSGVVQQLGVVGRMVKNKLISTLHSEQNIFEKWQNFNAYFLSNIFVKSFQVKKHNIGYKGCHFWNWFCALCFGYWTQRSSCTAGVCRLSCRFIFVSNYKITVQILAHIEEYRVATLESMG